MKVVVDKQYLGDIMSEDGKNKKKIKDSTNWAIVNVNKIINTLLNRRPFGRHVLKALQLMREGLLLGGMLTNSESWIIITKQDIDELEKTDTHFLESSFSKVFMMLELGMILVRFVMMKKRLQFLHYILSEPTQKQCKAGLWNIEGR